MELNELISPGYMRTNRAMHSGKEGYGGSGHKQFERVIEFARELKARNVLDYGCGESTLRKKFKKEGVKIKFAEYDPGIPGKSALPRAADLVVCTDVLEHIEPEKLVNVLKHICDLSTIGAYLVIATRPANKLLPNGANAHLIIEQAPWWLERIGTQPWNVIRFEDIRKGGVPTGKPHELRVWLRK